MLSAACVLLLLPLAGASTPLVTLSYGQFEGITSGNLSTFLGIRYAAPAVRFTLPESPVPFHGVEEAKTPGAACPQQALSPIGPGINFTGTYTSMSDDCLTLSVFAPQSATPHSKLPVFFWIYGGAFEVGFYEDNNVRPMVERSIFNGEPVVVVTPNYRGSAYGFLGGEEIRKAGISNLGLRDQIFALEWVQQHISAFGGDPKKVVIGGFSAGAWSVSTLLLNNNRFVSENLFRGAFMLSGSQFPARSLSSGQPDYDSLVAANNCTSARDTLDCLRHVPLDALSATVNRTADFFSYRALNLKWRPRVDGDVLVRDPFSSVQMGEFAKVPFINAVTDDEGTKFSFASTNVTTNEQFMGYLRNFLPNASRSQLSKVAELYPEDPRLGSPFDTGNANALTPQFKRIAAFEGDLVFQSARRYLLKRASQRQPTWSYLSKRFKSTPYYGAQHGSDVTLWLPTNTTTDFVAADFLIHFVNTLDPNHGNGLFWPTWNTASASGPNSLFTLSDPDAVNITAEDFRIEEIEYIHDLVLQGAAFR
ncbi:carotenoid ester lipase precursor [Mycena leptocephala]|nr:carotenoid ester lipase precursor [Mycena leptocephala]